MTIDPILFPARLAFGASVATELRTEVVRMSSGHEHRNRRWARPRRSYMLAIGPRANAELVELQAFFEARGGAANGFLFRDPVESSTAGGHDEPTAFDIALTEVENAPGSWRFVLSSGRTLTRLDAGSVRIADGGVELVQGADFSVDTDTGAITIASAPGGSVTGGCRYYVPVRFDSDALAVTVLDGHAAETGEIRLLEVLE